MHDIFQNNEVGTQELFSPSLQTKISEPGIMDNTRGNKYGVIFFEIFAMDT